MLKSRTGFLFVGLWASFLTCRFQRREAGLERQAFVVMEPLLDKLARQKPIRMFFETIRTNEKAMQKWFVRSAISAVTLAQIWWAFLEPCNLLYPASPETGRAIRFYQANRTAEAEAAVVKQMERDSSRNVRNNQICFAFMLVADVVAIYFLWNFGARKIAPNTGPIPKPASHV